jgi:hypothetical protein
MEKYDAEHYRVMAEQHMQKAQECYGIAIALSLAKGTADQMKYQEAMQKLHPLQAIPGFPNG